MEGGDDDRGGHTLLDGAELFLEVDVERSGSHVLLWHVRNEKGRKRRHTRVAS
jgi:hypothetical protein